MNCSFKPLCFGMVCYPETDKWGEKKHLKEIVLFPESLKKITSDHLSYH